MKWVCSFCCWGLVTLLGSPGFSQTWSQSGNQPNYGQGNSPSYGQPSSPRQPYSPGGLNAGGLAPPQPMEDPNRPGSAQTQQELEEADREDSGRGLEFLWLTGEVGFQHVGLQTFDASNLVDANLVKTSNSGLVYGAGLGLRLVFVTLGAKFRLGNFSDWQLWTLNGELGIRIPLGDIEPYFTLGGGYASMGSFDAGNLGSRLNSDDVDITGFNVRGGFGVDYYLTPVFSLGANLTGEVLALTRPGVQLDGSSSSSTSTSEQIYEADGSSIGTSVTATGVIGLHF